MPTPTFPWLSIFGRPGTALYNNVAQKVGTMNADELCEWVNTYVQPSSPLLNAPFNCRIACCSIRPMRLSST